MERAARLIHIALWLVLICNALWMGWENHVAHFDVAYALIKTGFTQGLFMFIFYVNYFWMVPRLLYRRKWWPYAAMVVVMILLSIGGQWGFHILLMDWYDQQLAAFKTTYGVYFSLNALTYLMLSGLAWFTWHGLKQSQRAELLEKQKARAELQALTGKVNPHFLFNTLNNIYVLVRKKHDMAAQAVLDLSGLMRYMLEHSDDDRVPLTDEVKMMQDYIALQTIRLEPGFRLEVEFPSDIAKSAQLSPLLFVPLLENVFKHGDLSSDGFIYMSLKLDDTHICWHSRNAIDTRKERLGTGLINLRERLHLLYDDHYELKFHEADGIFEAQLCIAR